MGWYSRFLLPVGALCLQVVFFSAQVQEETERVGGCDPPVALIQSLFLQEVLGLGPNTKHQAEKLSIFTRQRSAALQLPARLSTVRVWVYL